MSASLFPTRATPVLAALLGASLLVACTAWARSRRPAPVAPREQVAVPSLRSHPEPVGDSALADAEERIVANNPFRLSNTPPSSRYDPAADGGAPGTGALAMPPQPRPVLVLKAIVGGPPWQAVIDGIPGQPAGTVAQQGSKFDKLIVRAVTRDSVIVQGSDTSWVLTFRGRS